MQNRFIRGSNHSFFPIPIAKSIRIQFHMADSVPFRERILVTIEHGTEDNLTNDYSTTAYWYARPGAEDFFVMRPAKERVAIPAEQWASLRDQTTELRFRELRLDLAATASTKVGE